MGIFTHIATVGVITRKNAARAVNAEKVGTRVDTRRAIVADIKIKRRINQKRGEAPLSVLDACSGKLLQGWQSVAS